MLNVVGVRQATWAVGLFTVAKLLPLGLVVAIGLGKVSTATLATQAIDYYALTSASLLVLRRRGGEAPGFRLPLAGLVVPLAVGFCLVLLATRTFEQAWILALLVLAGVPLRWAAVRG